MEVNFARIEYILIYSILILLSSVLYFFLINQVLILKSVGISDPDRYIIIGSDRLVFVFGVSVAAGIASYLFDIVRYLLTSQSIGPIIWLFISLLTVQGIRGWVLNLHKNEEKN